jgi:hypothetical protein
VYRGIFYDKMNNKDSSCGDFRVALKLKNPQGEAYWKEHCAK